MSNNNVYRNERRRSRDNNISFTTKVKRAFNYISSVYEREVRQLPTRISVFFNDLMNGKWNCTCNKYYDEEEMYIDEPGRGAVNDGVNLNSINNAENRSVNNF